jgi:predicted amidohydrolase YtcJ
MIRRAVEETRPSCRLGLTPIITDFLARGIEPDEAIEAVEEWRAENSHRVTIDRRLKLMLDGAIFSGLAQFGPPGYLDGHRGVWMAPPEVTTAWAEKFWAAGFQLHAHTNGDLSTDLFIDILRRLQDQRPRPDHRMTLEHFAYSTEDQNRQLRALGAQVSANPYYVHILSDLYSDELLGPDRGSQMVRLGSLERLGVPFALHSDCLMAPLSPLTLAWAAATRETINGNVACAEECISLDAALRAITVDAAWIMGWENEIGSVRAGKRADLVVLDRDPYETGAAGLRQIEVLGTVFEGELAMITG